MNTTDNTMTIAAQRAFAYGLLPATLDYPDEELTHFINSGQLGNQCKTVLCGIYPELEDAIDWGALVTSECEEDLQVEYSRLFDVGASGPPCSLNGGVYHENKMQCLEEMVRFYNHFELTAGEKFKELPDHITTQMEFMHFLCHCEHENADSPEIAINFQRAQRDFLNRHLAKWVPQLNERVIDNKASPYFRTLISMITFFLQKDQKHVSHICGVIAIN